MDLYFYHQTDLLAGWFNRLSVLKNFLGNLPLNNNQDYYTNILYTVLPHCTVEIENRYAI